MGSDGKHNREDVPPLIKQTRLAPAGRSCMKRSISRVDASFSREGSGWDPVKKVSFLSLACLVPIEIGSGLSTIPSKIAPL